MRPTPAPRSLVEIAVRLRVAAPAAGPSVTGVTHDSREVCPGDLYAALPGTHRHGAQFMVAARDAGAVAVLTDPPGAPAAAAAGLPALVVPNPRAVLGPIAAAVYGEPASDLLLIGITGTNGKTTAAYLIEAGLRAAGHLTGLIGTVETRIGDTALPSARTTPEAPDLQAVLAVMRERGVSAVAMEVSSHALALHRVDGIIYDVALFTNLTQDHLDFHADFDNYFAAKARLFTPALSRHGVVCLDDPWGARLAEAATVPMTTYGDRGEWRVTEVTLGPQESRFRLLGPSVDRPARVRLPGGFNVANALGALVALVCAGVPLDAAVAGVGELAGVPGRMERIAVGQDFLAIVDYAHTPNAVATLLAALRPVTRGRLIVVLGCGGDRDRAKRPLMGAAAVRGADFAVLTSDNPRSEDPLAILAEMEEGAQAADGAAYVIEPDRTAAIEYAVAGADGADTVVVAGKGHEQSQEVAGATTPFDDRVVLRAAIERAVQRHAGSTSWSR